jgi:adenylate cyclase
MAAARVERRLAAILAADVVGYSRLMERDEAGTFARLKTLRCELVEPILARHGGRFVDLKGDGAIVEFQSAVEAVEAAVEIQQAIAEWDTGVPESQRIRRHLSER